MHTFNDHRWASIFRCWPLPLACLAWALVGCDDPVVGLAKTAGSAWASAAASAPQPRQLPNEKRKFGEATVYVDGVPRGVLKYSELPPTVKPEVVMRGPEPYPLFPMDQYLAGIGVDLAKLKKIHIAGGRRVAVMDGSEVVRLSKLLTFSFTRTTAGQPQMVWPEVPYTASTSVDIIRHLEVFQDKAPPTYDKKTRKFYYEDGRAVEGIAYGDEEKNIKATRLYADGRLLAAIRRKGLPDGVLVPGTESDPVYALDQYAEALGIPKESIKTVDLLMGDDGYARLEPAAFEGATFRLPHKRQGKIDISTGTDKRTVEGVTAIQVYRTAPLFDRDEKYYEAKPVP